MNFQRHDRGLTKFHAGSEQTLVCVVIKNSVTQGRIEGGATGAIAPGPPLQGGLP